MSAKEIFQNHLIAPISEKLRAAGMVIPSSMTMRFKRSQFERIVLKHLPADFVLAEQCFLSGPTDSVFAGFFAEKIPSGVRIYKFVFPAFINFYDYSGNRTFHLSFCETVPWPDDIISGEEAQNTPEIAELFLSRVESWIPEMRELKNLDGLYAYLSRHETSGGHTIQQAMGFTQILRDEPEMAAKNLHAAIEYLESSAGELRDFELRFVEETRHFLKLLREKEISEAKMLLTTRTAELKAEFGIA